MGVYGFNEGLGMILNQFSSGSKLISIAGGSCSGKTKLVDSIKEEFGDRLVILPIDAYYLNGNANTNFDHPDSLELDLVLEHINELKKGNGIYMPTYDFKTHSRTESIPIKPGEFILLEGLFALQEMFNNVSNYLVYMQADEKIVFKRRMDRDVKERGRTPKGVLEQYLETVKPMFDEHVKPQKYYANLIIENNKYLKCK